MSTEETVLDKLVNDSDIRVRYGQEAFDFLNTNLGKYLRERGAADIAELADAMAALDPHQVDFVSKFTALKIKRDSVQLLFSWMTELIEAGNSAKIAIDQDENDS